MKGGSLLLPLLVTVGSIGSGCGGDGAPRAPERPVGDPPSAQTRESSRPARRTPTRERGHEPQDRASPATTSNEPKRPSSSEQRRRLLKDPEKLQALRRRVLPGNIAPVPKVSARDLQRYLEARPKVLPGRTAPVPKTVSEKRYRELRRKALQR